MNISDKQLEFLYARLADMAEDCSRGIFRAGPFFSLSELQKVKAWLSREERGINARIFGGYCNAERARVYFLPDYMSTEEDVHPSDVISEYGYEEPTAMLKITASGFRSLTHRDFMGSLLSLGIERDVVGDIVIDGDFCAYVFCDIGIAAFICDNLTKVANDAVKVSVEPLPRTEFGARRFETIHETVMSGRLDAIVGAVCNLSREISKKLVLSGMCELNHECEQSPDRELKAGDVFSVRGYGKYKLSSYDGENRRGRQRITVQKYI